MRHCKISCPSSVDEAVCPVRRQGGRSCSLNVLRACRARRRHAADREEDVLSGVLLPVSVYIFATTCVLLPPSCAIASVRTSPATTGHVQPDATIFRPMMWVVCYVYTRKFWVGDDPLGEPVLQNS